MIRFLKTKGKTRHGRHVMIVMTLALIACMSALIGHNWDEPFGEMDSVWFWVKLMLPVILVFEDLVYTHDVWRSVMLLVLPFGIGLGAEILGTSTGSFFGGKYEYAPWGLMFMNVPLIVAVYWSVLVYVGYGVVNGCRSWLHRDKYYHQEATVRDWILDTIADGIAVVAIDLAMDPFMVSEKRWTWADNGAYFGIPVMNFVGWFVITVICTGLVRWSLMKWPSRKKRVSNQAWLFPVLFYALITVGFAITAVKKQLVVSMWPGVALMGVIVAATFSSYFYSIKRRAHAAKRAEAQCVVPNQPAGHGAV